MKIHAVRVKLFHEEVKQTDTHDDADSSFSQCCERA